MLEDMIGDTVSSATFAYAKLPIDFRRRMACAASERVPSSAVSSDPPVC